MAWIGELIVQIRSDDITIQLFSPYDGSESAAIKVVHRHSGKEVVNDSTLSQRDNLRHAMRELVGLINPDPDSIVMPELTLFDRVKVQLPQSVHDGEVRDLSWDYTRAEWKYFVECSAPKVTNWYVRADLQLHEE